MSNVLIPTDLLNEVKSFHEIRKVLLERQLEIQEKFKADITALEAEYALGWKIMHTALADAQLIAPEEVVTINTLFLDDCDHAYIIRADDAPVIQIKRVLN